MYGPSRPDIYAVHRCCRRCRNLVLGVGEASCPCQGGRWRVKPAPTLADVANRENVEMLEITVGMGQHSRHRAPSGLIWGSTVPLLSLLPPVVRSSRHSDPANKLPLSPPPPPPAEPTTLARGLRSTLPARAFPVASRHSNPGNKTTTITTTTTTTRPPHSARPRLAVDPYSTHIPGACSTRC